MRNKYLDIKPFVLLLMIALIWLAAAPPVFAHDDGGIFSAFNLGMIFISFVGGGMLAVAPMLGGTRPNLLTLAGLALIGMTGWLHLVAGVMWTYPLLVLNGLGYLVLGLAWVWPERFIGNQKRTVTAILAVYTVATIIGYFVTHLSGVDALGLVNKVMEVALLVVLGLSYWRD